jgi:hypothetical protein
VSSSDAIRDRVVEIIPQAVCGVNPKGALRIIAPADTTLAQLLELRAWLVARDFMFDDGGFSVKPAEGEALLVVHLNTEAL